MSIMLTLQREGGAKLTHLAKKLETSSQEVYRHLSRLTDAMLVQKGSDGDYKLTAYGEQTLRWVPGYKFLSDNRDYFTTHDLSALPDQFSLSLGKLEQMTFSGDVMLTIYNIERMIKEAEEYVWIMIDQMIFSLYEPIRDALKRGVKVKVMRPSGWTLNEEVKHQLSDDLIEYLYKSNKSGKLEQREPKNIDVFLALSEKTVASLGFVNLDGKHDYLAFKTDDSGAQTWCEKVFNYYWETGSQAPVRT